MNEIKIPLYFMREIKLNNLTAIATSCCDKKSVSRWQGNLECLLFGWLPRLPIKCWFHSLSHLVPFAPTSLSAPSLTSRGAQEVIALPLGSRAYAGCLASIQQEEEVPWRVFPRDEWEWQICDMLSERDKEMGHSLRLINLQRMYNTR